MKRASEGELGKALRGMDLGDPEPYVWRIPDPKTGAGVANWKPCDFMVFWREIDPEWVNGRSRVAWVEAKDTDGVDTFPWSELRPSQIRGAEDAYRLGIPALLAIYWRRAKRWTISDFYPVVAWFRAYEQGAGVKKTSIPRQLLMSRYGVDAAPRDLGQTIKVILEDGW